jgi:hypothetical protein
LLLDKYFFGDSTINFENELGREGFGLIDQAVQRDLRELSNKEVSKVIGTICHSVKRRTGGNREYVEFIETDIRRIQRLAKEREDANWAFRCFLKRSGLSIVRIDRTVHDLHREVSQQIDCTQCANCCKTVSPLPNRVNLNRPFLSQERVDYLKRRVEAEYGPKGTGNPYDQAAQAATREEHQWDQVKRLSWRLPIGHTTSCMIALPF